MLITKNTFAFNAKFDTHSIFRHLNVFIKIVECNSFTEAAQKLNTTPSSVSRSLLQLEEQLGVVLLKRNTRNFFLTEAGHYLLDKARHILSDLDEALVNTSSFYKHAQGQLKVTCSIAFGVCHLVNLYSEYREKYPNVNLSVDLNDEFVNLNEREFDLALRITAFPPDNFAIKKLCDINWVYCGSKTYFEQYGIPKKPSDLVFHSCLVNPNVAHLWQIVDQNHLIYPLQIKNIIEVNSSLGLLHAVRHHQGIACLPTYMLADDIQNQTLMPILTQYKPNTPQFGLYALYSPAHIHAPKMRTFIDFLAERISTMPYWENWRI